MGLNIFRILFNYMERKKKKEKMSRKQTKDEKSEDRRWNIEISKVTLRQAACCVNESVYD